MAPEFCDIVAINDRLQTCETRIGLDLLEFDQKQVSSKIKELRNLCNFAYHFYRNNTASAPDLRQPDVDPPIAEAISRSCSRGAFSQ